MALSMLDQIAFLLPEKSDREEVATSRLGSVPAGYRHLHRNKAEIT
jgi:hypothetical protein